MEHLAHHWQHFLIQLISALATVVVIYTWTKYHKPKDKQ